MKFQTSKKYLCKKHSVSIVKYKFSEIMLKYSNEVRLLRFFTALLKPPAGLRQRSGDQYEFLHFCTCVLIPFL